MNQIENKVDLSDLPAKCELRKVSGGINNISLVELDNGTRLMLKDETEILIPKSMRAEMIRVLHMTHQADTAMMTQAKKKIFWSGMKADLQQTYKECPSCQENKESKANKHI